MPRYLRGMDLGAQNPEISGIRNSTAVARALPGDMDMKQKTRISAAAASVSRGEDGRQAARWVAMSMGLLFSLIFVLQAFSW